MPRTPDGGWLLDDDTSHILDFYKKIEKEAKAKRKKEQKPVPKTDSKK